MQIILTPQESEQYFYNALCNGLGEMPGYGLELAYNGKHSLNEYDIAKQHLLDEGKTGICYEDVLMQILRDGNTLTMVDVEGEGEYTRRINMATVHDKVQNTPLVHLQAMIDEQDDAITADVILQTVFFDEIVFG